jgi:hypothetical protein
MHGFTKLFHNIITSTVWTEDNETRITWITLLALADYNGMVSGSVPGIAKIAGLSVEATRKALNKFQQPDLDSRSKEHEGRRIETVDGGYKLLNFIKYREKCRGVERREYLRIKQREFRAKKQQYLNKSTSQPNVHNVNHKDKEQEEEKKEKKKEKTTTVDSILKTIEKPKLSPTEFEQKRQQQLNDLKANA